MSSHNTTKVYTSIYPYSFAEKSGRKWDAARLSCDCGRVRALIGWYTANNLATCYASAPPAVAQLRNCSARTAELLQATVANSGSAIRRATRSLDTTGRDSASSCFCRRHGRKVLDCLISHLSHRTCLLMRRVLWRRRASAVSDVDAQITAETGRSLVSLQRRLLASFPAMTAEAALRAAEVAELVKVGSHVRWQRQGGVTAR